MENSTRKFIKNSSLAIAGISIGASWFSAKSYANIIEENNKVRLGVVGFLDRFNNSNLPSFLQHYKELNFDIVAVSDLWKLRREEGTAFLKDKFAHDIRACRKNDELYGLKNIDGVFLSSADFQHANLAAEAVKADCDVYCEKPFAETMEDARMALKTIKASNKIVQIGSQRRSGTNYMAAEKFI